MVWKKIKKAVSNITKAVIKITKVVVAVSLVVGAGYMLFAGAGSLGFFGRNFLVNAGLALLGRLLNGGGGGPSDSAQQSLNDQGRTTYFRETVAPHQYIYGETRCSGPLVYVETTGAKNIYMHKIIAFAAHEVDSFSYFYLNDEIVTLDANGFVTNARWVKGGKKLIRIRTHNGTDNQAADAALVGESTLWTADHRLQGIAYAYVRLEFDQDKFADGVPQISAVIKGKKVYNPKTGATAWSDNPALCLRDYLLDTRRGLGALSNEIDEDYFRDAQDVCDETVQLASGGTEKRYTTNGVFNAQQTPKQVIEIITGSMAGQFWYSEGEFRCNAAKWRTPSVIIDEDDLRGPVSIQTKNSRQSTTSGVKGIHVSAADAYQQVDYAPVSSQVFVDDDNDTEVRYQELPLPVTVTSSMAQRIAKTVLYRSREQLSLKAQVGMKAFQLQTGDVFEFRFSKLGYDGATPKYFEVTGWQIIFEADKGLSIGLDCTEISEAVFDWNADEKEFQTNNLSVTGESIPSQPDITVTDTLRAFQENAITVLQARGETDDPFHFEFECEYRRQGESSYINLGKALGNLFEAVNVEDKATYEVRMRSISQMGRAGPYASVTYQVVGKTDPPQDVTGLGSNPVGDTIVLTWDPVSDLDLSYYEIKYSSLTNGSATWGSAVTLVERVGRPSTSAVVPAATGTYFVKAHDKGGNESINAASTIVAIDVQDQTTVQTLQEDTVFSGTKTNTVVQGVTLQLAEGETSGVYEFANQLTFNRIFQFRAVLDAAFVSVNRGEQFDSITTLFDQRVGKFDGDGDVSGINVEFQIRTSSDGVNFGDWKGVTTTIVSARAAQFRILLGSDNVDITPSITIARIKINMFDRIEAEPDLNSTVNGRTITFAEPFQTLQGISIAAGNMSSGDFYSITNKTVNGFTIQFFDSSSQAVARTFDYVAKGFGRGT